MLMAVFFVLTALALLLLRRGPVGRLLIAMRDSPAACGTLGLDLRWFRVALFGLSAGMAGLAGALYAGLRQTIGAADFQFFNSLLLLLLAVVFGVTSVTGATLGGIGLMLLPVMQSDHPSIAGLIFADHRLRGRGRRPRPQRPGQPALPGGPARRAPGRSRGCALLPVLPQRGEVDAPAAEVVPGLAETSPPGPQQTKEPAHVAS